MTTKMASTETQSRRPAPKNWCPGAYRPMMSGDGLIVRVRPRLSRLTRAEISGLARLATDYGNGQLGLTNRANLQIRGIQEPEYEAVLGGLDALGLLDASPEEESRRNILIQPFWTEDSRSARLARGLNAALPQLPDLPAKFGFAIDDGPRPLLTEQSADIRLESDADGGLIIRADGWPTGRSVSEVEAIPLMIEMARWYATTHRAAARRMADHVAGVNMAQTTWIGTAPAPAAPRPKVGQTENGWMIGAAFGDLPAADLLALMRDTSAQTITLTPWRRAILDGTDPDQSPAKAGLVTVPNDPLMQVSACVGAPYCPAATVDTRSLARELAPFVPGGLHVSGCAKGCAHSKPCAVTLVGRGGKFDLVRNGAAWDDPQTSALDPDQLMRSKGSL